MGKADAFSIPGLDVFFYSSDHRPPHVHIRKAGEWEIRVYLLTCTDDELDFDVKWPSGFDGPGRKTCKQIRDKIFDHKAELLAEWEAKVDY